MTLINVAGIVPKSKPPSVVVFVSKSPNVAPNGRVKIKANQNKIIWLILVTKCNKTTMIITPEVNIAPCK
jgi:hypothetical protein